MEQMFEAGRAAVDFICNTGKLMRSNQLDQIMSLSK